MRNSTYKLALALASVVALAQPAYPAPADWIELKARDVFTMQAPPGSRFHSERGIDSFVGSFIGPGFKMSFDYGAYSQRLSEDIRDRDDTWEKTKVDGKVATITSGIARNHAFGCSHYVVAADIYTKPPFGDQPISLFIVACVDKKDGVPQADMMLRSIRFKR